MIGRYGRYEVLYKLGQGAMAQVFLARDPILTRFVAVKVLHAELASRKDVLQRFFNEARTVAVIRNPHVVEVFDFGQEGKDLYLVMEFVDGLSLQSVLRQLRPHQGQIVREESWNTGSSPKEAVVAFEPLDSTVTAALMCHAAEGLAMAAQHNVVHRDIKPENLMINQNGYLKISDFGIAHVQDDNITKTGAVLGSPLYMSPEQARGLKPITSQADIFSLGAVFYSCLAGHPPFRGKSITDLFRKISTEPHVPLLRLRPDLDPALGNLVETMLQKRPGDRGGGPRWLHRQLKGYLMALGVMDPAELIGGYLQQLSAQGCQTTWKSDSPGPGRSRPTATLPMESYPPGALPSGFLPIRTVATERYPRENKRSMPVIALGAVLGILFLAVGGLIWSFLDNAGKSGAFMVQSGTGGIPTGNASGTLASLGSIAGPTIPLGVVADSGTGRLVGTPLAADAGPRPGNDSTPVRDNPDEGVGESGGAARTVVGPASFSETAIMDFAAADNPTEVNEGRIHRKDEDASVVLKSSPPFAEAFVDGRFVGVTPVRVESLLPGHHRILLKVKQAPAFDTVLSLRSGVQAYKFRLDEGATSRLAVIPDDSP
ncbi:MAG: protein kinase [Fibrobacterota bacterium]|nr:protein kinase [Fibrobacterota bacterium]